MLNRFTERMVLTIAILSTGIVFFDQTGVNVALPAIQEGLGADFGALQWIIDIYLLVLSVLMLIGGVLGDIYGRVRLFIIGMIIFAVASLMCGLAPSVSWLIIGRFFQGVGGAIIAPAGLAIINAVIPTERRGEMLGIWGTFSPLITVSGPVIGGWMVDNLSWRFVFIINLPLALIAIFIAWRYVPENRNEAAGRDLDWGGALTLLVGLSGLLFTLIEGPNFGWGSPVIVGSLILGIIGILLFIWVENRVNNPLIRLDLFRIPAFSGANLLTLILYAGLGGPFFFITLNLQQIQGFTAAEAGLAIAPISLIIFLLSRPMGRLTDRIGPRPILIFSISLIGCAFLLLMRPGINSMYWRDWFPGIMIWGLGIASLVVPITALGLGALPQAQSGIASGVNNAASRIGQMLSFAILGVVVLTRFRERLTQELAILPLSQQDTDSVLEQYRSLGEVMPPAGISNDLAVAIETAVQIAFVDGFRLIMMLSAVTVFASLAVLLWLVPGAETAASLDQ